MTAGPRFLPVVILGLAALALLKGASAWIGFASASASEEPAETDGASPPEGPAQAVPELPPAAPPPERRPDMVERRILEQLADRRAELDAREAAIDTREQLLLAAERRIASRFSELDAREKEIEAAEAEIETARADDFEALAGAYERMKARDAAQIFNMLEDDILAPLADGMRTQALAGVLAEMNPEKARRLTILLAERRRAARLAEPSP